MLTRRVEPMDGWNQTLSKRVFEENSELFMRSIHATYPHPCGLA